MEEARRADGGWADVLAEGRLPLFILICLSVWVTAVDALIATTIMPSVGRALGGYGLFGWATAGFLLASVVAGASSGLLALRVGLRAGTAAAALLYALGCVLSAAAPEIWTFLAGRVLQGLGGGWVSGFSSVAIGLLFPNRLLPRVYAASTSIWGVATLLGPMIGGLFADAGAWPWVFWTFALQGVAVAAAAWVLLPKGAHGHGDGRVAWPQLALVLAGVACIGAADLAGDFLRTALLTAAGVGLLLWMVRLDARSSARLLPLSAGDLRTIPGAGYASLFLLTAASMGLSVYGPAVLQTLHGLGALTAGYVIACEALVWTLAALPVSGLTGRWPTRLIRLGAICVLGGVLLSAAAFPAWNVWGAAAAAALMGAGFGLSFSFTSQRILGVLSDEERALGAAAVTTVRLTGSAAGAATAAAVANLVGFSQGLTEPVARATGLWIFVAAAPVALLGVAAAWRLARGQS